MKPAHKYQLRKWDDKDNIIVVAYEGAQLCTEIWIPSLARRVPFSRRLATVRIKEQDGWHVIPEFGEYDDVHEQVSFERLIPAVRYMETVMRLSQGAPDEDAA